MTDTPKGLTLGTDSQEFRRSPRGMRPNPCLFSLGFQEGNEPSGH